MNLIDIKTEICKIAGNECIRYNEPMKNHTTFKVGGPADIYVEPYTMEQLATIVAFLTSHHTPFMILGNGSNLIVRDHGIRGCVVSLANFNKINTNENEMLIYAECGARLSTASNAALNHRLKGMEFASGIPGTIGGAVTMNAGAYGPEIKDILAYADVMDMQGNIFRLNNDQMDFSYRHSIIQTNNYIVLGAAFKLEPGNTDDIRNRMNELNTRRSDKQPLEYPSAGSTFKRPEGHFAAKLIEDCGLKGFRVGGAMVSEKHSGFIINYDNCSAADIINLIHAVQDVIFEKYGISLETEVKIIGEE